MATLFQTLSSFPSDQGKIISLDTPLKLIQELLGKGFEKKVIEQKANLEDVFLDLTGHGLRES